MRRNNGLNLWHICNGYSETVPKFGYAFAVAYIPGPDTSVKTTVITVIIVGAIISSILAGYAMRNSYLRKKPDNIKEIDEESAMPVIFEEIEKLPGSAHKKEQIAMNLFNLVQTKISSVKQEMSEKYGKIIEEKDITGAILRKNYEETMGEKKQTEAIVRSIAEGLVVVDDKGKVLLMNPAAEKLLGVKKTEKIGKPLLEDVRDEQLFTLVKNISEKKEKMIELTSPQDITKKTLRASSAIVEDENGKTVGMVSVLSDITKLKELEQLKSDFVYNVTHELRTPIETLRNSVFLMLNGDTGPITEAQRKFLDISERNIKRLSMLIDSLLDAAKIQEKKMELTLELCSIEKIVEEVCEILGAWAINKSISILTDVQKNIPEIGLDKERITQVFNNLIGNAIKFTPKNGSITISVRLVEGEEGRVEISVADTGVGIKSADQQKIFDKFCQGGERTQTDIAGTGLGLYITKEIVELHNGKIWVESEKGRGAKFTFMLPVKEKSGRQFFPS